ncbi:MAG: 4Fe-4S dicluster domain-containing protein [Synergistaceae bacterium]|jgi:Fe-S-cluster-containing hydrogenase component 2|nr:4Fe-4S dicluster domain-containing protein [Synergistaceae bacterium]
MKDIASFESGVLSEVRPGVSRPPKELWRKRKGGLVVVECPQRIPCNPCHTSCPTGAIVKFEDINDVPAVDYAKCTGCALCVAKCPGLACFVIDIACGDGTALMKLPYEMLPLPERGGVVKCLGRTGEVVCDGEVKAVAEPHRDRTMVVHVAVPEDKVGDIRAIRVV